MKLKTRHIYIAALLGVVAILLLTFQSDDANSNIVIKVQKGTFEGVVYASGQLQASSSVSINAPKELSAPGVRLDEIKITSLVEEGTAVDSGGFVATLDHAAVEELRKEAKEELEKALSTLQDAKVDTGINLSNLRDELLNIKVTLEEKELIVEQSKYEAPSEQRKVKLDVERTKRDLKQKIRNYDLKVQQEKHKIFRASDEYRREQEKLNNINKLFDALNIKAPAPGIVIYSFDRMGGKIKTGSSISRYSPQIAELPDLSTMISKTFINEVDVSKIKAGQKVKVGVDAFPDKKFDGQVIAVANIGQVIPGGNSKVFEVSIQINKYDADLKPGMTTSNVITTNMSDDVLFVPLEAIYTDEENVFVYHLSNNSIRRKQVEVGDENENFVIVKGGLSIDDQVLLNQPEDGQTMPIEYLSKEQ